MASFLETEEAMVFKKGPEINLHQITFQALKPTDHTAYRSESDFHIPSY